MALQSRKLSLVCLKEETNLSLVYDIVAQLECIPLYSKTRRILLVGFDNALSIKFKKSSNIKLIDAAHFQSQLGHQYDLVFFNAFNGLHPSSFAALSDTLSRQGEIFLFCPLLEDWTFFQDPDYQRIRFHPTNASKIFIQRFVDFILQYEHDYKDHIRVLNLIDKNQLLELIRQCYARLQIIDVASQSVNKVILSAQQQNIINEIVLSIRSNLSPFIFFISGERGRGKSTLVADVIHQAQANVVITAASRSMLHQIETYLATKHSPSHFKFYAPDDLIVKINNHQLAGDKDSLLIIEEAARLPLPMIKTCLTYFDKIILVSTTLGYEGSANGLMLKLESLIPNTTTFKTYQLEESWRFQKEDALEKLIQSVFLLNYTKHKNARQQQLIDIDMSSINFFRFVYQNLSDENILKQIYHLLAQAHYKTSPDDLRLMLDAKDIEIYYVAIGENQSIIDTIKVVSVVMLSFEGPLSDLKEDIFTGKRRPKGQLTPVTLSQHCGLKDAVDYKYCRIIRIATLPAYRQQNIASELIACVEKILMRKKIDFMSTSFSESSANINFWQKQGMIKVKKGRKLQKSTAKISYLFIKPLIYADTNTNTNHEYDLLVEKINLLALKLS